jgi:D-aminopeptidase
MSDSVAAEIKVTAEVDVAPEVGIAAYVAAEINVPFNFTSSDPH